MDAAGKRAPKLYTSKDSQDIAPQSREIVQTFVWWRGHESTLVSSSFVCLVTINLVLY